MPIYKLPGKKNGLQRYRVRINFTDSQGNARSIERVTYGMAEAQVLLATLQYEYTRSSDALIYRGTLNDLYNEYHAVKAHEIRATSLNTMDKNYRNRIDPFLGTNKLQSISTKQILDWKRDLNATQLAPISKQKAFTLLKAVLEYGVKAGYIATNPAARVDNFKTPDFKPTEEKLQYYTPEQFLIYIETARALRKTYIDYSCYVFFNIAFYTGMRKGEINALKWSDLDGNVIHVRRSIAQKLTIGDIETVPKNKSSYRDIQAPVPLLEILKEHRTLQTKMFEDFSYDFRICGGDNVLRDTTIERFNTIVARKSQLPHIRIHDFRHSHASLLANSGINIQEIARRLGHSDIKMTWNTYSHLYPREEERALSILNEIK